MELPVRRHSSDQDSKRTEVTPPKRLERPPRPVQLQFFKLTGLDKPDKKHMKKNTSTENCNNRKLILRRSQYSVLGNYWPVLGQDLEVRSTPTSTTLRWPLLPNFCDFSSIFQGASLLSLQAIRFCLCNMGLQHSMATFSTVNSIFLEFSQISESFAKSVSAIFNKVQVQLSAAISLVV